MIDPRVLLIILIANGLYFGGAKAVHGTKVLAAKTGHAIAHVLHKQPKPKTK